MSPFRVEIPSHAKERLKLRGISREAARKCLAKGDFVGLDVRGRNTKRIRLGRRTLEVVYLDITGGYLVVTAYWVGVFP